MKILVTGAAGFIGSHCTKAYLDQGHSVIAVDDLSSGKQERLPSSVTFYNQDITSPSFDDIVAKHTPDVINHLAAQIVVTRSVSNPAQDAHINIIGTIKVAQSAVKHKVKQLIFSSSAGALYGHDFVPATEAHTPSPVSPYGLSKHAAEKYLQYFHATYLLPVTILRYGNVYGPGQDTSRESGVVALFTTALLQKKSPTIFGDGSNTRDYVYVKDVAKANVLALSYPGFEVFNIATNTQTSTNEVFSKLTALFDSPTQAKYAPARIGEQAHSQISFDKAEQLLGWKPSCDFSSGLKETVAWYTHNYS